MLDCLKFHRTLCLSLLERVLFLLQDKIFTYCVHSNYFIKTNDQLFVKSNYLELVSMLDCLKFHRTPCLSLLERVLFLL